MSRLVVESGKRMATRLSGLGAMLTLEGASDKMINPWGASVDFLRGLGERPYDLFNHTGNMFIGLMAGAMASYVASGAQKGIAELCGRTETASVTRMNRITTVLGVAATAAAGYAFEKMMGSPDMADVIYPLGAGALASGIVEVQRTNAPLYSDKLLPVQPLSDRLPAGPLDSQR